MSPHLSLSSTHTLKRSFSSLSSCKQLHHPALLRHKMRLSSRIATCRAFSNAPGNQDNNAEMPFSYLTVEDDDTASDNATHNTAAQHQTATRNAIPSLESLLSVSPEAVLSTYTIPPFLERQKSDPTYHLRSQSNNHVPLILDEFIHVSADEYLDAHPELMQKLRHWIRNTDSLSSRHFDEYFSFKAQSPYTDRYAEGNSLIRIMDNLLMSAAERNTFSHFASMDLAQKQHIVHLLFSIAHMRNYSNIVVHLFDMLYSLKQDERFATKRQVKGLKLTPYIFEKTFLALGQRKLVQKVQWLFNVFEQTNFKSTQYTNPKNPLIQFTGDVEATVASIIEAYSRCKNFQLAEEKYDIYEGNRLLSSPQCFEAVMMSYAMHVSQLQQNISELESAMITNNPDAFTAEHVVNAQNALNQEQSKRSSLINEIQLVHERAMRIYREFSPRIMQQDADTHEHLYSKLIDTCLNTFNVGKVFTDKLLSVFVDAIELQKQNTDKVVLTEDHYVILLKYLLKHEEELLFYFAKHKNVFEEGEKEGVYQGGVHEGEVQKEGAQKEKVQKPIDWGARLAEAEESSSSILGADPEDDPLLYRKLELVYNLIVKSKQDALHFELDSPDDEESGVSHLPWNILQHMQTHLKEPLTSRTFSVMTTLFCTQGDHRALSFVREAEEHFDMHQTPSICLSIVSLFETLVAQKKMTEDDLQFAINNAAHIVGDLSTSTRKMVILNEFHELYAALTIIDSSQEFLPEPVYQFCVDKLRNKNSPLSNKDKLTVLNKLLKLYIRDGIELKITQILDLFFQLNLLPNESTFKVFMREFQTNPTKWMSYRKRIRNMYPSSRAYTCTAYILTSLDAEKARKTLDYMRQNDLYITPTLYDYVVQLLSHVHDDRAFKYIDLRIKATGANFYLMSYIKTITAIFKNFYPPRVQSSVDEELVQKLRRVYNYMVANGGNSLKLTQAMMNLYTSTAERRKIMSVVKYRRSVQHTQKFRPLNASHYMPVLGSGAVSGMVEDLASEEELVARKSKDAEEKQQNIMSLFEGEQVGVQEEEDDDFAAYRMDDEGVEAAYEDGADGEDAGEDTEDAFGMADLLEDEGAPTDDAVDLSDMDALNEKIRAMEEEMDQQMRGDEEGRRNGEQV